MSNYWKKKLDELNNEKESTPSYWGSKLNELEESKKKSEIAPVAKSDEEIAPVAENKERKWFEKGAFSDGYQFGDIMKTLYATSNDLGESLTGGILDIGEAAVDAGAYLVGGVGGLFSKDFKEKTKDFIAKDLYDGKAVARAIMKPTNVSYLWTDSEKDSVLGDKTDSLAASGGQLLGTAALQAAGVPWFVTTGVTSFGGEMESAFNEGASYGEAGASGLISAGAEILTEKLSGGIKFGGKALDDVLTKQLTTSISNKAVRTMAKLGMDVFGEGAEEVLSQVISNLGTALYKEESLGEILASEEALDEYLESFIGGAVLGGASSGANAVKSAVSGRDATSGLTANEEKVFNKVYEDRVAEAEEGGKKLTLTEKNKIYDEVIKDLEKGRISTETIESVLGGETYKAYQDTIESENNAIKELEALYEGDELTQAVNNILENSKRTELKEQLSREVSELAVNGNDSFLSESYNEATRRKEAFTADLTKYDAKTQEHIKRAIDSGVLNNTNRTHEFVDMIAKISADKGVLFDYTNNAKLKESGFAVGGATVNGFVTKDGVTVNIDSSKSLNSIVGHEITHVLEGTEFYDALQETIFEYAKTQGVYDERLKSTYQLYKTVDGYKGVEGFKAIKREVVSDLVGDYLFTDTDFINNLSTKNRNVFQKVYDEIKYLYKVATAGSKEARELERVKKAFEQAYRQNGTAQGDTKYSLAMVEEVQPTDSKWRRGATTEEVRAAHPTLYAVDETATEERNPTQVKGTVGSYRKIYDSLKAEGFDGTILDASSGLGYGTQAGIEEYGFNVDDIEPYPDKNYNPKYTDYSSLNKKYDAIISNAVLNVLPQDQRDALVVKMGELLNDGGRMFVNVRGKDVLNAAGKIAINEANMEYFIPRTAKTGSYQKGFTKTELVAYLQDALGDGYTVKATNMFGAVSAVVTKNGSTKYSLSDSDGNALTKEQGEYFKDSKMRDDNGNLKVMYHGSQDAGFHTFDSQFSDDGTSFFFVDRNDVAASYSGTSETYAPRVFKSAEDANNFLKEMGFYGGKYGYEVVENDGKFTLFAGDEAIATSDNMAEIYEEFCDYEGVGYGDANYKVYLNLTNPLEVDAEGRNWNNVSREFSQEIADRYNSLTAEEKAALADLAEWGEYGIFRDEILSMAKTQADGGDVYADLASAYEKLGGANANLYDAFSIASDNFSEESIKQFAVKQMNTRDYAKKAKAEGYDGVIFKNIHDNGGYSNGSEGASTVAIAFSSEQIKSVANEKPTGDKDIRFSLSESVEETKDLMALHNLHTNEVLKQLDMGGMPYPSIAVTNPAKIAHEGFGEITVILRKDAIDPKNSKYNKIYGADAYTPTFPSVDYLANREVASRISDKVIELYDSIPEYYKRSLTTFRDYTNINDVLNSARGEAGMLERYANDHDFKQLFLADQGKVVPVEIQRTEKQMTDGQKEMYQFVVDSLGADVLKSFTEKGDYATRGEAKIAWFDKHGDDLKDVYADFFAEELHITKDEALNIARGQSKLYWSGEINRALEYMENGGIAVEEKEDFNATNDKIDANVNTAEYKKWLANLFGGIEESSGIRNNKEIFTPSGNRRSFSQTHDPVTIENVIKVMRKKEQTGQGAFGSGNIQGASAQEYKSIEDVKKNASRLGKMDDAEHNAITRRINDSINEIADRYSNGKDIIDAKATICEAVSRYETKSGIANYLKQYDYVYKYTDEIGNDIIELRDYIRSLPTPYFEAKPRRAVGFDEVGVFVIPRNADAKLKQELLNRGYAIAEYDPDVKGDRQKVVNSFEEYKFSLSNVGETPKAYGKYNVYGKDVALEKQDAAPVNENVDAAPVAQTVAEEFAPTTEAEANAMSSEMLDSLTDADVPPEVEAPYYENDTAAPDNPFDYRDIREVGNQKVKAYMYENPEVKPFFQEEASVMLGELERTTKGERWFNNQLYYDSNGERGFFGTKRHTSDDIAYLLDTHGYTYAEIEKGLNAIIEDNGKENNACSKRIEFLLNDRLLKGYRDMDGFDIPANDDYVRLLNEKQIIEYSDEARRKFFEVSDDYAPMEEPQETETAQVAPAPPLHEGKDGQQTLFEDVEKDTATTRKGLHQTIVNDVKSKFAEKGFDFDAVLKKAKNLSTFATVDNTPQRVMEKALGYKEGQVLSDLTVNKVAQNETDGVAWLNSFTDRKEGVLAKISKQYNIKPGSKESAAAQMYAEGFYVDEKEQIIAYGDAELKQDFPNAQTRENIKGLANDPRIRQIYDETLAKINESRARNAYPEIQKLDNYFLHFRAMEDTFSRLGLPFNPNDIRAKDLPTDLNGVTADLKPGQPYFASAKHREGKRTSFDLLGGLERYLSSAKNQIYHIDDIQTLRALRNYIADTFGQANGLEGLDALDEDAAQERIKQVYGSHLSTFAKFLNEEANILAGKTALIDRGLEGIIGRRGITFLDTVNKQVGSNMVGFNVSSSLTNFLPVVQTFAKSNKADFVKAFAQTASNKISSIFGKGDNFAENSPVMIRRKGADRFYRTPFQKVADAGYVLMGAVDNISTELIARTKFNEFVKKGMDEKTAHIETDKWVSRLMGDRSLGQMPQLYNSKMLGLITKFQLEVRNQLDSQFYDTIQEAKASNEDIENALARNAKTAAKVASTFVQLAVAQHLFGKAFESVAGYNPAFDIIDVIIKAFGFDDDEDSEDTALDNIEEGFLALLEDLPYTSTLTGGRIPISSALPIKELIKGEDQYGNEKSRLETLGEIAPYYVLPTGYGQIKKSVQGLDMFSDDHPIAGSYTDSGNLRFPVDDTLGNKIQAGIFGQWANDNARDYFDKDIAPLTEKQTAEFAESGMSIQDYWRYRDGLKDFEKQDEKVEYINGLNLSDEQKNVLKSYLFDEKGYAEENPEKYAFLESEGIGYLGYKQLDDDTQSAWSWAFNHQDKYRYLKANGVHPEDYSVYYIPMVEYDDEDDAAYSWAFDNPEKATMGKAFDGGVKSYRKYASELYNIKADKDEDGKSISGSRKEKVIDYINNLDIDYGEKIILFKSEYNADDTYNYEIIDYLNSRDDISYEETETILKELGFTVDSEGNISW